MGLVGFVGRGALDEELMGELPMTKVPPDAHGSAAPPTSSMWTAMWSGLIAGSAWLRRTDGSPRLCRPEAKSHV